MIFQILTYGLFISKIKDQNFISEIKDKNFLLDFFFFFFLEFKLGLKKLKGSG